MKLHKNARLTPQGRRLMVRGIEEQDWKGWRCGSGGRAVCPPPPHHWLGRDRAGGERMLCGRSSPPARSRAPVPTARRAGIERLRRPRMAGRQIARRLAMPGSTAGLVLRRLGRGRLKSLDPKPPAVRHERQRPGELIHIDTKKLGRIDGIGHRITGYHAGVNRNRNRGTGRDVLHVCIDDASRLACTEILPDEKKPSAIAFLDRALAWFGRLGVAVERIMTDNGAAYRRHDFRQRIAAGGLNHIRTRPCTPRTNGKAERFIQTSLREWAYARPDHSSAYGPTPCRPGSPTATSAGHTQPVGGISPAARLNNVPGFDS